MDLILEYYENMLLYAKKLLNRKVKALLYNEYDVVHEVFAEQEFNSYAELKYKIKERAIKGCFHHCEVSAVYLTAFQPLDEKVCNKCKDRKYVIYDFQLMPDNRKGKLYYYFNSICKACEGEKNSKYRGTDKYKTAQNKRSAKNYKNSSESLTDTYIKNRIVAKAKSKGINLNRDIITKKDIEAHRQMIIKHRLKKYKKQMAKIIAPFTDEQVKKLQAWQEGNTQYLEKLPGQFINMPVHPFTCCSHNDCNRLEQPNEGALIPTNEGWICPCGKYKQDWCHDFMINPSVQIK